MEGAHWVARRGCHISRPLRAREAASGQEWVEGGRHIGRLQLEATAGGNNGRAHWEVTEEAASVGHFAKPPPANLPNHPPFQPANQTASQPASHPPIQPAR